MDAGGNQPAEAVGGAGLMGKTYIAKKQGFKPVPLENLRMALRFVEKGWTVEVYKEGRKSYTIKPEE